MHTPKEQSRRHAKKYLQPLRRKPGKNHFKTVPVVLEDAVAFPVDLSERSTLPAACSTQPTLRCNLAARPEEPQQGQEQLDPFFCSIPPRPWYSQPALLVLDLADLLVH